MDPSTDLIQYWATPRGALDTQMEVLEPIVKAGADDVLAFFIALLLLSL